LQRALAGLLTAWAAVTFTFFILHLAAGDPVEIILSQGLSSPERIDEIRVALGYDLPLSRQYLRFLLDLFRGDLGTSLLTLQPVTKVVAERLPSTLQLAVSSLLISLLFGFSWGILSAWNAQSLVGRVSTFLSGLALGVPVAATGILSLMVLARFAGFGSELRFDRLVLPAGVLGFAMAGPIAGVVRSGLQDSMSRPYFLAARASGHRLDRRLLWQALRPSLPPAISLIALEAAFLLAGTVVTETVFGRPGLGRLLVRAILQGDFPIALAVVALAAIFYSVSQMVADGLAHLLDPRLNL
jgi:peptide/nickel transport system permease protein